MPREHAVGAVLLWSSVASAFKLSLRYMTPLQLLTFAFMTSFCLYGVLYLSSRKFRATRDNLRSAFLGFLIFLYYVVLFSAYSRLPAQEAQALNYTWPLMLVILSLPFLNSKPGIRTFLGLSVGFLGAIVVATRGHIGGLSFADPVGVSLALGSAVLWALYWIFNVRDERELVEKMFWNFLFALSFASIADLFSGFRMPHVRGLLGAAYVGLFEMGVTYLLWYRALEDDVAFASNLAYLVPFISLIFIALLVGETIAPATVVGLAMIIAGILIGR